MGFLGRRGAKAIAASLVAQECSNTRPDGERMVRIERAPAEEAGARRELEDRLDMARVDDEPAGEIPEQRVVAGSIGELDLHGANLAAARIRPHASSQCVRSWGEFGRLRF